MRWHKKIAGQASYASAHGNQCSQATVPLSHVCAALDIALPHIVSCSFSLPENVTKLIDYAVDDAPEGSDNKVEFIYPYKASEVRTCLHPSTFLSGCASPSPASTIIRHHGLADHAPWRLTLNIGAGIRSQRNLRLHVRQRCARRQTILHPRARGATEPFARWLLRKDCFDTHRASSRRNFSGESGWLFPHKSRVYVLLSCISL